MILTSVGEIGVHSGDRVHLLRPSLYAMSQLGDPAEIVELFANVMADHITPVALDRQFMDALAVLQCCSEEDLSYVFGYLDGNLKYHAGAAEREDILVLARSLLRHGISGDLPALQGPQKTGEYVREFQAREHVATAMAHLGMSEREAWDTTMTSLVGALRSKYPPSDAARGRAGGQAPTMEEHDATMEWFDAIDKKRKSANKQGIQNGGF